MWPDLNSVDYLERVALGPVLKYCQSTEGLVTREGGTACSCHAGCMTSTTSALCIEIPEELLHLLVIEQLINHNAKSNHEGKICAWGHSQGVTILARVLLCTTDASHHLHVH